MNRMATKPLAVPGGAFSSIRRVVARHPVAAFLTIVYTVNAAVALIPILTRRDILPFDMSLYESLGTIFGVALPAFLVAAATGGREGVRDLARRCMRWRVGGRWYLVVLLGMPIAVVLLATVIFGAELLNTLVDKWRLLFTVVVPQLLLLIVLFNVAEEIGWTGFLQARLQERYGPLKACAMTAFPFAVFHLPVFFVEEGLTVSNLPLAVVYLGFETVVLLFARVVIIWLYNSTGQSVLLAGLFHCSFNATVNEFNREFLPGFSRQAWVGIASAIVVVAAVIIAVSTKGRLSYGRRAKG